MSQFRSITVLTQPAGSGVFADPTAANHFVPLGWLENRLSALDSSTHVALSTISTPSFTFTLPPGTQQLSGGVRRKLTALTSAEGLLVETADGLAFSIGSGATAAARGSDLADLVIVVAGKAAAVHSHAISDVVDLATVLSGKAAAVHGHVIADVAGLQSDLDNRSLINHGHVISDISGLSEALAMTTSISGTWEMTAIIGLSAALAAKSEIGHLHAIVDVTGLVAALAGKSDTTHTHAAASEADPGFMSAADKAKLNSFSANEQWLPSVSTKASLPLNLDPVGASRMVLDEGVIYTCVANVGFVDDQWKIKQQWLPSVATYADLPLGIDPIGATRLVQDEGVYYYHPANTGALSAQWTNTQQWRSSVATAADLPLGTDPVGTTRLVRSEGVYYYHPTNTGVLSAQWTNARQWRESVATYSDLPLGVDPVGTVRLVRAEARNYHHISNSGAIDAQWSLVQGAIRKVSGLKGDGASLEYGYDHNLGTAAIVCSFVQVSDGLALTPIWSVVGTNSVHITFDSAPGVDDVRVTVIG